MSLLLKTETAIRLLLKKLSVEEIVESLVKLALVTADKVLLLVSQSSTSAFLGGKVQNGF